MEHTVEHSKKKIRVMLLVLFVFKGIAYSQDVHFSQFSSSPLVLNPALAGQFDGSARLTSSYRNQWTSVSKHGYNTFATSVDAPLYHDKVSGGLSFYNDRVGDSRMGTNSVNLTLATKIKLDKKNELTLGLQPGWAQRSVDLTELTWDTQYDGQIFNSKLPSGESATASNMSYFDISAGTYWKCIINNEIKFNLGLGSFHLNRPKQSFYQDAEKLYTRWTVHGDAEIKLKGNYLITYRPSFMILKQGPSTQKNVGLIIKYSLDKKSTSSAVSFGAFSRFKDAFILYFGYDYKKLYSVGLSYDINYSGFQVATGGRGGFEVSMSYKFAKAR